MSFFLNEELTNPSKRYKFLASILKHAFPNCHISHGGPTFSSSEEDDDPNNDYDDEHEEFVSEIRSRYMEAKSRRKTSPSLDSFCWALCPTTGELVITPKAVETQKDNDVEEREDFFSVGTCFSSCSSATNVEAFQSLKTNFSRCSSLSSLDLPDFRTRSPDFWRRSIIWELCNCEGWPFGLCRKALLLPPLPKSPSESWSWRKSKSARTKKLPRC